MADRRHLRLRPELCAPVVSPQRIAELRAQIVSIERLLHSGHSADAAITAFNDRTGHAYTSEDFLTYDEVRSVDEFAVEAARPAWPRARDVTRDELVEIVRRIRDGDDQDYYLRLLEANVVHPGVSELALGDASPEQAVDEALRYRPIAL